MRSLKLIEIQDYLNATSEAAQRTRSVVITMVVASTLIFGALVNSLQHQWMFERIHAFYDPHSDYVKGKIMPPNFANMTTTPTGKDYDKKYEAFYEAMVRSYVENTLSFRVPLFGFNVDVNDIGIMGGLAFTIILIMYRFCLAREIDNLRIAKREAMKIKQLREFYDVLAMRQVFTVPESDTRKHRRSRVLLLMPKMICALPVIVHFSVTAHDIITYKIGGSINPNHNLILISLELSFLLYMAFLTLLAIRLMLRIDCVWDRWWHQIHGRSTVEES